MLVGLLEDVNPCEIHVKCVMILPRDLHLAMHLHGCMPIKSGSEAEMT